MAFQSSRERHFTLMHLEFLLEEASMEVVLRSILSQLANESSEHTWETHPHQGKQDLLKWLPGKMRAYSHWLPKKHPYHHIVIVLDRDSQDCKELKNYIQKIVANANM